MRMTIMGGSLDEVLLRGAEKYFFKFFLYSVLLSFNQRQNGSYYIVILSPLPPTHNVCGGG